MKLSNMLAEARRALNDAQTEVKELGDLLDEVNALVLETARLMILRQPAQSLDIAKAIESHLREKGECDDGNEVWKRLRSAVGRRDFAQREFNRVEAQVRRARQAGGAFGKKR